MRNWRRGVGQTAKMGNPPSVCKLGHSHRSKLEGAVCQILQLRQYAGEIELLQVEDHITICGPPGHSCPKKKEYVADFRCKDMKTGRIFFVEAKGFANDRWPTTKILWRHYGPGNLEVWGGGYGNPRLIETIYPLEE